MLSKERKDIFMIRKFEVENFKGFKDKLVFDLTAGKYGFNQNIVVNGIVNKAIVYGKNGVGKSTLGIAMFDIVRHLTDKERMNAMYLRNYINLDSESEFATFRYFFKFGNDEVAYEYKKKDPDNLICEKLTVNGKILIDYDYFNVKNRYIDNGLAGNLNIELVDNKLSVIKYIYRNTPTDMSSPVTKMMRFCDNMLWYRGLSEGNSYCGFSNGGASLVEMLYESGKIHEFERFLKSNGLDYELKFISNNGNHELVAVFNDGKKMAPFVSLASTGTMALFLFYIWSIKSFDKISFLFIDEFDAFFHYESAEDIVKRLNENISFQTVLTSHNTYLMQNKLTRPDCCYIMTDNKIRSLFNSTKKEIRESHNLEKMYVKVAFNE